MSACQYLWDEDLSTPERERVLPRTRVELDDGDGPLERAHDDEHTSHTVPAWLEDGRPALGRKLLGERQVQGLEDHAKAPVKAELARAPPCPDRVRSGGL